MPLFQRLCSHPAPSLRGLNGKSLSTWVLPCVFLESGKSGCSLLLQPFLLLWERKKRWRIMETSTSWQGDCKVFCISSYFTLTFYSDCSYDSWLMAKVLIRTGQDIFISSLSIEISNLGQPKQSVKFFIVFLGFFFLFFLKPRVLHFNIFPVWNVSMLRFKMRLQLKLNLDTF